MTFDETAHHPGWMPTMTAVRETLYGPIRHSDGTFRELSGPITTFHDDCVIDNGMLKSNTHTISPRWRCRCVCGDQAMAHRTILRGHATFSRSGAYGLAQSSRCRYHPVRSSTTPPRNRSNHSVCGIYRPSRSVHTTIQAIGASDSTIAPSAGRTSMDRRRALRFHDSDADISDGRLC